MTRILGLMHAPWLVAVYFLLARIIVEEVSGFYGLWMRAAVIVTGISLVLNVSLFCGFVRAWFKGLDLDSSLREALLGNSVKPES